MHAFIRRVSAVSWRSLSEKQPLVIRWRDWGSASSDIGSLLAEVSVEAGCRSWVGPRWIDFISSHGSTSVGFGAAWLMPAESSDEAEVAAGFWWPSCGVACIVGVEKVGWWVACVTAGCVKGMA